MMWKALYRNSSGDHGTLAFFRNQLRRTAVTSDPKKDVNACVDLIITVMKGHILQSACDILKVDDLGSRPRIPAGLKHARKSEKLAFISDIAQAVVERCTLVEEGIPVMSPMMETLSTTTPASSVILEPCSWNTGTVGERVMARETTVYGSC